jgi:FlaA1/EpsC-like NDP-sugar epimerase
MGATKKIMEMFLNYESKDINISSARFANVAFSDGSLLHGLNQRILKRQPISAPTDIQRYFLSSKEAGELCLMSCLLGDNNDIFFPKQSPQLQLTNFTSIISNYLISRGFEPFLCQTEEEARLTSQDLIEKKKWPCYFFKSDTSGEKAFEEFYTNKESVFLDKFIDIGIVKNEINCDIMTLNKFYKEINVMRNNLSWNKEQIIKEMKKLIPQFSHDELKKNLDEKM